MDILILFIYGDKLFRELIEDFRSKGIGHLPKQIIIFRFAILLRLYIMLFQLLILKLKLKEQKIFVSIFGFD